MPPTLRAACCHVSPIFLSAKNTTEKALSYIREAAQNGADLVVFAETFIPAFPLWSSIISPAETHDFFIRMATESVYIDGEEVIAIRNAAKENNITVSVGISEKVHYSSATLFNANLIIGNDGEILVHHRKLMPTFFEKLTWSPGDGNGLKVVDVNIKGAKSQSTVTPKLGMLICGENTNSLARYSLIAQGEQIHISTWPAIWPTRIPSRPVTIPANGESRGNAQTHSVVGAPARNYDNLAANRTRAAGHCFEAKCFGIVCAGYLSPKVKADLLSLAPESSRATVEATADGCDQAESMFLDPTGTVLPGFVVDPKTGEKKETQSLRFEEGILYADLDMQATIEGKQYHDIAGGYQRLDIFNLQVNTIRRKPATFIES